jgi:hypothetical protein
MLRVLAILALGAALLTPIASAADADALTVDSILAAHRSGASTEDIFAMIDAPATTIAMAAGDLVTLRDAGVAEPVITEIWSRLPAPAPDLAPQGPDDARLVDLVSLIRSGISESIVAEQIRQSSQAYRLSVTDLLYLKHNEVPESTIAALLATHPEIPAASDVAPPEIVFDDLLSVNTNPWLFWRSDRSGRLVLRGETLAWEDRQDAEANFELQVTGLEKVWFTCDPRSGESFCYQINFEIMRGDVYEFRDARSESGSNAAVLEVMEALRRYFPRLTFGAPED